MNNEKVIKNFENWLIKNDLCCPGDYKWWNVDTSFIYILSMFKTMDDNNFSIDKNWNKVDFEKIEKIKLTKIKNPKALNTIGQYISIGIILNAIEINEDFNFTSKLSLLKEWYNSKIQLKFKEDFIKNESVISFLIVYKNKLLENFKIICNKFKKTFLFQDLYKILFNLYIFYLQYEDILSDEKNNLESFLELHKQRESSSVISWHQYYKINFKILGFVKLLFEDSNLRIDYANINNKIKEYDNETIGIVGESIFEHFAKHKNLFESNIKGQDISNVPFKNIFWESNQNKFSPFDFKIDNYFFEVKSTIRNENKNGFIISENEYRHMEENKDNSYLCFIKNIDMKIAEIESFEEINEYIKKLELIFYTYDDIRDGFTLTSRGYYAIQN
ncbi:hypothetical protein SHELI_v1c03540 [Spiroplasma helicoides]|uniref:Protein NO VEIN C-terminal domain-containing protein n=1 Tax=Spiroplasma helicoides TaxID=216938 RepID=A0A1B3SK53_9MOLU|nr:DUF3883 domain-containing protein [Spiroplasma helicoides]AOG60309.1 hypothetical protein SHELI_v1c03540 [Spiroplasma helicoides]